MQLHFPSKSQTTDKRASPFSSSKFFWDNGARYPDFIYITRNEERVGKGNINTVDSHKLKLS